MDQSLKVQLEQFHGALPFLLVLVQKNELDVESLEIGAIVLQLKEKIKQHTPGDVADGAYVAACLLLSKLQHLIPSQEDCVEEDDLFVPSISHLLEFQSVRSQANWMELRQMEQKFCIPRLLPLEKNKQNLQPVAIEHLVSVIGKLMQRVKPLDVYAHEDLWTVQGQIEYLQKRFDLKNLILLEEVFDFSWSKEGWVVTFLAILEWIKQQRLTIKTDGNQIFLNYETRTIT